MFLMLWDKYIYILSYTVRTYKQTNTLSSRETVNTDFLSACQFLKDHMDNMDNPNDDMVSSLDSSTETFNQT